MILNYVLNIIMSYSSDMSHVCMNPLSAQYKAAGKATPYHVHYEFHKSLQEWVQMAAQVILPTVLIKYYADFTQYEDWLSSAPPLSLLKQATEERMYVLRDFNALFTLNIRSLQWNPGRRCPKGRTFSGVELLNGYLYTFEWQSIASRTVARYNMLTHVWSEATKFPDGLAMSASVVHNGSLYVVGYLRDVSEISHIYVLRHAHTAHEAWEVLNVQLPIDTGATCCVSFHGNIWIRASSYVSDVVELMVLNLEACTLVRAMVLPSALGAQFLCVGEDQLYCYDSRDPSAPWEIQRFNVHTVDWEPVTFNYQHVRGFRLSVCGDKIVCMSSEKQQYDAYCTRTGKWDSELCGADGRPRGVRTVVFSHQELVFIACSEAHVSLNARLLGLDK